VAVSYRPIEGGIGIVAGYRQAAIHAGIRKAKLDLALIVSDVPAVAAGVFTRNVVQAWCVRHDRVRIASGRARAILANSGNANACTGDDGRAADERMASLVEAAVGGPVLTASTGVIGRPFPIDRVEAAIPALARALRPGSESSSEVARAIMTTDLVPKEAAVEFSIDGVPCRIGGVAKGSGMIAPNMGTMLAFLVTDAAIERPLLDRLLRQACDASFNRVAVDGDSSTNDMTLFLANGVGRLALSEPHPTFVDALDHVCQSLARMIARDGEGATKLVEIVVRGAGDGAERVARTIAESPLVKTALFGNDPNWGRILAAAGRAGIDFDPDKASIALAGTPVYAAGGPTDVDLAEVSRAMGASELLIEVDLGDEGPPVRFWTCDMSYDYVRINAEYTT
jgi:glutamate N-acetyltransferase/amino-acid N-acetyltransferase